ncbi:MAG: ATP-dependent Clp protease ATP-binding subunit ClpC, partial [Myxococcales bacterium]|nr:ATP-dependent Clp protease ATP-binding subunit ClpC [Myxococcales bacterium]
MERALPTRETELATLRRTAEDLAKQRGQKPTTTHLLAALAGGRDDAAQLLLDRRLDAEVLLKAARVTVDDAPDAIARAIQRARELAGRSGAGRTDARSVHVLFSLCQETGTAAHRALVQCGTDVTRLRTSAMQLAMGLAPPRRTTPSAAAQARTSGIMPIAPPVRPTRTTQAPLPPASRAADTKPSATIAIPPSPIGAGAKVGSPASKGKRKEPVKEPAKVVIKELPKEPVKITKARLERFALDAKQFPLLCALGQNLTQQAVRGELDPVVGRDAEIERALDVLAKRYANNACLIGAPGVGKTSVVRGLAARIADGDDVACFEDKVLVSIEPAAMLAGTGVRGSLAERIGQLKAEIARAKGRVILFFDEMHVLFGQDAGDEASSELRLALARGEIVCIGATTEMDYRRVIDADPGLSRCFTPIEV